MDREQQLTKLVNVLRRTARSARGGDPEVVERSRQQFNRVLDAVGGLDESVKTVFSPLEEGSSGAVIAAACKELAAYFADEVEAPEIPFDSESFRDFWQQSAKDIEEVGEFIKESLGKFQREHKRKQPHRNGDAGDES